MGTAGARRGRAGGVRRPPRGGGEGPAGGQEDETDEDAGRDRDDDGDVEPVRAVDATARPPAARRGCRRCRAATGGGRAGALSCIAVVCLTIVWMAAVLDAQGRGQASPASVRPPQTKTPQDYPAAQIEAGRAQFASQCGFCHGRDAAGGAGGTDLTRSTLVAEDTRGDRLGPAIRARRQAQGMPALAPAGGEDRTARARAHAQPDSVRPGAPAVVGLEGALALAHDWTYSRLTSCARGVTCSRRAGAAVGVLAQHSPPPVTARLVTRVLQTCRGPSKRRHAD